MMAASKDDSPLFWPAQRGRPWGSHWRAPAIASILRSASLGECPSGLLCRLESLVAAVQAARSDLLFIRKTTLADRIDAASGV